MSEPDTLCSVVPVMVPPMISLPSRVIARMVPVVIFPPLMVVAPSSERSWNVTMPVKVILAREITDQAGLIVASQPTRGLDIGATEFVHQELLKQKSQGKSVVLISADLDELLSLSDRIAVMFAGKIVGILDRVEADVFKIGLLMGGVTGEEAAVAERQEAAEPEAARLENARASAEKQETVGPDGCRNQPAAAGGQSRKGGDVA